MRLAFFGTGYVGLVSGVCFAELGNDCICVDVDPERLKKLQAGEAPFYEPGLSDLMQRGIREGRLTFTGDDGFAVKHADILFITVGTPPLANGGADLSMVYAVAETIGKSMDAYKIIVIKSTVPVGSAERVRRIIKDAGKKFEYAVVSNPEFLREGQAIYDFMHPDKVVIGSDSAKALEMMQQLYSPLERPNQVILKTNNVNAELIKYANNGFLATKISFMNELAGLCEKVGGDIKVLGKAIGLDNRIGPRFLQAGAGYGGSCFPKDVKALVQTMEKNNLQANLLRAVELVNEQQKKSIFPRLLKHLSSLEGKQIAVWGLSFKPKTDDIREAPAITFISQVLDRYGTVVAYDPEAMENMRKVFPKISFAKNPYACLQDADALVILTEWDEFRQLDKQKMKSLMKSPLVVDGRNVYEPEEMRSLGFVYESVGRT
ncbi:MAG: UDP-glucose/GDP-mannose dehydrogenase family protein [Nanoarchaeota archaeon]